jgi:hypothetical protein
MMKVFIEPRPKGRQEGSPIDDYVVEEEGDRVLKTFKTQEEAITWAKGEGHSPSVARVRHMNDKRIPDHCGRFRRPYSPALFSLTWRALP